MTRIPAARYFVKQTVDDKILNSEGACLHVQSFRNMVGFTLVWNFTRVGNKLQF